MKRILVLAGIFVAFAAIALGGDPPVYDKGTLLSMDSNTCGSAEKGSKTLAGEILGTDDQHKQTQEVLCQEYVLESDRIVYHIRPKDDKHPVLLPVGEKVEYRIRKDMMYLRDPEGDKKERQYTVVSMEPRQRNATDAKSSQ